MRVSLLLLVLCSLCAAQDLHEEIADFLKNDLANDLLGFDVFENSVNEMIVTPRNIEGDGDIARVATALGNVAHPYILALGEIVQNIELRFGDPRGLDPETAEVLTLADEIAGVIGLEFSPRLNTYINTTISPVKYAPNINTTDSDFLLGAFASGAAVPSMQSNWNNFPNLKYQYFASESGFTRFYPAFQWPESHPDFDARMQSWYANAGAGPKTVVLLIRRGHDYGGALEKFLGTFSEKDFLQIVEYGDNQTNIPECFSVVPSQMFRTSTVNLAEYETFIGQSASATMGADNAEEGFRKAFETHQNTVENPTFPTCLPKIVWLPGPNDEQDNDLRLAVGKMNEEFELAFGRGVIITVYQLEKFNQFAQRIACETVGGEYRGNIEESDLGFILARHYLMTAQSIRTAAESAQFVESAQFTFRHSSFLTTTFRPDGAELTPRLIYSIVQPVYSGRRFIGTAGIEFEMLEFQQALEDEIVGATGVYVISDQQGATIVHPTTAPVDKVLPNELFDLRLVEVTPAFFSVRTGIVDAVAGSRSPIAMIRRNREFQQTVLNSRYDWNPVVDTPLSVAVGRSSGETTLAELEPVAGVQDEYFVSAFVPFLDPDQTESLNLTIDPFTGEAVSYDFATYNLPSNLLIARELEFNAGTIETMHNYLNDVVGTRNTQLKPEAKTQSRVFASTGLRDFWKANQNAAVTERNIVFLIGESAVYPGRSGGSLINDLRLTPWYQRAIDFLPSPVPSTFSTDPMVTLSTPQKNADNENLIVTRLSLVGVSEVTPVAVLSMEFSTVFFWENFVSKTNNFCKLINAPGEGDVFCVLLDHRANIVADAELYKGALFGTEEFDREFFLGDYYASVATLLTENELLVQEPRVDYVTQISTQSFFVDAFRLGTLAGDVFVGNLSSDDSCGQASEVVLRQLMGTNMFLLTLSLDFDNAGCTFDLEDNATSFFVTACEEATFAYRSPTDTENCPFPVFWTNEALDPFRVDNFTCGDLEKFFIIDWIRWDDGIAIAFVSITAFFQFIILILMLWVWTHQDSAVIRMASPIFCEIVLLGCQMALSTVYFLTGEPTENICRARAWFFAVGFSITFGALFAKTWRLHKIHRMARDFKNKPITMGQLMGLLFLSMLPTLLLLILWSSINTLEPREIKDDIDDDKKILQCQSDNQWTWQGLLIGVNAILVLYGCYVSIVTRKIRLSFNESRYIGLAIYNVAVMAPIGIAIGSALENNMIAWYAILCATIIAGTVLCVFVLFVSKLRIHYFKSEKNTLTTSSGTGTGTDGTINTL